MRELYRNLLESTNFSFEMIPIDNSLEFASNEDLNIYYIIGSFDEADDVTNRFYDIQQSCYGWIGEKENFNVIKKNCYFIVFVRGNMESSTKKMILELEESTLYFKKNIILYEEDEMTSLLQACKDIDLNSIILKDLHNPELFKEYKNNSVRNHYSLLLKMIIKTPHITIGLRDKHEFPQIREKIETSLVEVGKKKKLDLIEVNSKCVEQEIDDFYKEIDSLFSEVK